MRVIFVLVADRPACAKAPKTALSLGKPLGANVMGRHISAHSKSNVTLPADLAKLDHTDVAWASALDSDKKKKKKNSAAETLFEKVAALQNYELIKKPRSAAASVGLEKVGSPDKVLSIMGPVSDGVVASRPASKVRKLAHMFLSAALLNFSRPVLILLVMGAHSRSHLRQRLFGGVTDFMLHKANIPVLMLHS